MLAQLEGAPCVLQRGPHLAQARRDGCTYYPKPCVQSLSQLVTKLELPPVHL